jgi:hypothetical protein
VAGTKKGPVRQAVRSSKASAHVAGRRGRTGSAKKASAKKWSAEVMQKSDAMDLQPGVFTLRTPAAIARSLKRSSEASHRRKSSPFRSAMSMLNFEINRGGKNLSRERLRVLGQAKQELRKLFGRPPK